MVGARVNLNRPASSRWRYTFEWRIPLSAKLIEQLRTLTAPHIADGCLRSGLPIRVAPPAIKPLTNGMTCVGRARPIRHLGSIDIFFEALEHADSGDVFVIDNGGRQDEACIGDIVALEAQAAGIVGFVIWGLHRDSKELSEIGFPIFSMGSLPTGPQRLHPRPVDVFAHAIVGNHTITEKDIVVADANGVIFLPEDRLEDIVAAATAYRETEARQLAAMQAGRTYRSQTRFAEYLEARQKDPSFGFRQHLKQIELAGEV